MTSDRYLLIDVVNYKDYTWFPQGGVMECSRLLTHVNDAITTHYDHSMMCNDAVTAP